MKYIYIFNTKSQLYFIYNTFHCLNTTKIYSRFIVLTFSRFIVKIEYKHIRHGYARIDKDGKLLITIPVIKKDDEAFKHILIEKGKHLLKRFHKKTRIYPIQEDGILLFGELVPMEDIKKQYGKKLGTDTTKRTTHKILVKILEEYTKPIIDKYSKKIGKEYTKLNFRRTKSKRGSCTHDQHLSFNLDLVHLPTKFIRYVIIHECCHLKIKNHSKKFRELVESLCPEYKETKKELQKFVIKT